MALTLAIVAGEGGSPAEASKALQGGRLTIGRGAENDWSLPDPARVVSKHHCIVEGSGGSFRLTDCSTNGVFVNGADEPVGAGNSVNLRDGDRLQIGPYEVQVTVTSFPEPYLPSGFPPGRLDRTVLGDVQLPEPSLPDEPQDLGRDFLDESQHDLLGPLSPPGAPLRSDVSPARRSAPLPDVDAGSPLEERFAPLAFVEAIPDDWLDETGRGAAPVTAKPGARGCSDDLAAATPPPQAPAVIPPSVASTQAAPAVSSAAQQAVGQPAEELSPERLAAPQPAPAPFRAGLANSPCTDDPVAAFLAGAGLDDVQLSPVQSAALMRTTGEVLRTMVEGLMEVLAARRAIKSELRLDSTQFKPAENNPLKFSTGPEDALRHLLVRRERGYLAPNDAVAEAFRDVEAHQVAFLAGVQEAWRDLLDRFDPGKIEQRIGHESGLGGLLASRKARCWDAFTAFYHVITEEARDDFEALFGHKISRAYKEQVQRHHEPPR